MEVNHLSVPQAESLLASYRRINLWHGSVRSGKTYISILRWLVFCAEHPMGQLMMVGKTLGTLRNNIIVPMQKLLGEKQCRFIFSTKRLYLNGRAILVEGANDDGSEAKIRGITLAGAYCDEVSLWPESFWTMLLSRCSEAGAKLFATTNPDSPYHWLKVNYIDKAHDGKLKNFIDFRFHLDDNDTLPAEYVESIKAEYAGLFYRRFIEGEWVQAEGAIYDMWDEAKHVLPPSAMPKEFDRIFASCDYGTTNPFAAGIYGILGQRLYKIKEYHYDSRKAQRQKTDSEYADDMMTFLHDRDVPLVIDPSAASFKAEMRKRGQRVLDADNDVLNGIRLHAKLLATGRFFISAECHETKLEYPNYVWDKRAQDRGEDAPLKQNDHHCVTGDTLVWTDRGLFPIVDLIGTVGRVRAFNEETNEVECAPYQGVALIQTNAPILEVELEDGSILRCTPDHEFLTQRGRVRADELTEDDEAEVVLYPAHVKVKSITPTTNADVYCLTVPKLHNFAAGERGIFISNCDEGRYACMYAFGFNKAETYTGSFRHGIK